MNKIQELSKLKINTFIIDFEDAIKASQRNDFFLELDNLENAKDYYLRVPLHALSKADELNLTLIHKFIKQGFTKFVFPKISSTNQLEDVLKQLKTDVLEIILLVETPKFYLQLQSTIFKYSNKLTGIGLGSHDFMSVVGGKHTLKNLEVVRQNILYLAKSCNLNSIDIASMDINDDESFKKEVVDGFNKGYDAKFIIHPKQLKIINSIQFYSEEEYKQALKIEEELSKLENKKEFNPIVIDGKIIEQPHINRAKQILKNYKK
ncbi:aldolase/citrate lyase family protein [Algibacter sp. L4_22]|nr:aldolase/citrate lyase family protein [Algibacter sp. L4_22]